MRPHHLHGADRLLLGLMLDERAVLGDILNLYGVAQMLPVSRLVKQIAR